MNQIRGILCLSDAAFQAAKMHTEYVQRLIFHENEPLLLQAQTALWRLRKQCAWVCVAADEAEAFLALALAAQLPVDRLVFRGAWLPRSGLRGQDRERLRLRSYALKNLPLVIADALLIGSGTAEIRALSGGRRHGGLCALGQGSWQEYAYLLDAPWQQVMENNLINPWKCV